jgi:hypothetical protein
MDPGEELVCPSQEVIIDGEVVPIRIVDESPIDCDNEGVAAPYDCDDMDPASYPAVAMPFDGEGVLAQACCGPVGVDGHPAEARFSSVSDGAECKFAVGCFDGDGDFSELDDGALLWLNQNQDRYAVVTDWRVFAEAGVEQDPCTCVSTALLGSGTWPCFTNSYLPSSAGPLAPSCRVGSQNSGGSGSGICGAEVRMMTLIPAATQCDWQKGGAADLSLSGAGCDQVLKITPGSLRRIPDTWVGAVSWAIFRASVGGVEVLVPFRVFTSDSADCAGDVECISGPVVTPL